MAPQSDGGGQPVGLKRPEPAGGFGDVGDVETAAGHARVDFEVDLGRRARFPRGLGNLVDRPEGAGGKFNVCPQRLGEGRPGGEDPREYAGSGADLSPERERFAELGRPEIVRPGREGAGDLGAPVPVGVRLDDGENGRLPRRLADGREI